MFCNETLKSCQLFVKLNFFLPLQTSKKQTSSIALKPKKKSKA